MHSSLLNNAGDTVRLLNANKLEKQSMEFSKITQGNSVGRISLEEDVYCEQSPSKNTPNADCITKMGNPSPPHKPTIPTKKISIQKIATPKIQLKKPSPLNNIGGSSVIGHTSEGVVLGIASEPSPSPVPYLSGVSVSYSVLTIVSLFIKMRNA